MKAQALKSIIFILISYLYSVSAGAAIYKITFYESLATGTNLFADYQVSGTATFEIDDAAVGHNNLVLFTSPDFINFDAILNTTAGDARFTLGIDDFPPKGVDATSTGNEQGILFDASGQPLRFDNPSATAGNGAQICDPACDEQFSIRKSMTLWDNDGFDRVFLTDGTITTLEFATTNNVDFTRFGGKWTLRGYQITVGGADGLYQLQAVPVPAAIWLFGSGLIGLIGISKRKK